MRYLIDSFVRAVQKTKPADRALAPLDPLFRESLLSMYRGEPQVGDDGMLHPLDGVTKISPVQGMFLHDLCVSMRPESTLEVGMAFGFSTLYFLAAIVRNDFGKHVAIDPYQHTAWCGVGATRARELLRTAAREEAFELLEERSDRAATDLGRAGATFDVVFIDGNHRFDDVLVDFYLYAPLCARGGVLILDDMWMRSVRTAASFVQTNRRDFVEVRTNQANLCVFRKVGDDARSWDDFHRFSIPRSFDRNRVTRLWR